MNPVLPHPQLTCIWMLRRPIGFDVRTQYTLISAPPPLRKTVSSPMTGPIPSRKRAKTAPTRSAVAPSLSTSPVGFNLVDLGSLATQILAAQADSSLQLHQSFQINMLENIRATSTLLGELVVPRSRNYLMQRFGSFRLARGMAMRRCSPCQNSTAKLTLKRSQPKPVAVSFDGWS